MARGERNDDADREVGYTESPSGCDVRALDGFSKLAVAAPGSVDGPGGVILPKPAPGGEWLPVAAIAVACKVDRRTVKKAIVDTGVVVARLHNQLLVHREDAVRVMARVHERLYRHLEKRGTFG